MGEIWGVKWEIFEKILGKIYENLLYIFENIGWLASGIDASEISRSLSVDSLNIGPFCHKLVKVHLTNLYIRIGSKYMLEKIVLFYTFLSISFLVVFNTFFKIQKYTKHWIY